MKKLVIVMMVALMATVSVCAQRAKRYDTATLNKAEELMNEGKLDESLTVFKVELEEHPKNPYAHFQISTVYCDLKMYDSAMVYIDNALKYMPNKNKMLRGE
mgnify:CR=1 FL=1